MIALLSFALFWRPYKIASTFFESHFGIMEINRIRSSTARKISCEVEKRVEHVEQVEQCNIVNVQ